VKSDRMGTLHNVGSELPTVLPDGWQLEGTSVIDNDAGAPVLLARWKRSAGTRQRLLQLELFKLLGVLVLLIIGGCGAPFESESHHGSELAGAPSAAGSIAAAGSLGHSGSAGSGGAAATPSGGAAGDGGAQDPPQQGGDGGEPPTMQPMATACARAGWRASASTPDGSEPPANALDGLLATRWSSRTNRAPGQWFELELGGAVLDSATLDAGADTLDVPDAVAVELDGAPAAMKLEPATGRLTVHFVKPRAAQRVRFTLTSSAPSWWSIAEVEGMCR